MVIDVLYVGTHVILATTVLMPSAIALMNVTILCRTAPTRFLPQEHHTTKIDLVQGIDTPTAQGTGHTSIMVPDISARSQSHCHSQNYRSSSFGRHDICSSSSHYSSLCCHLVDGYLHLHLCHDTNRHSWTPSHTCHFCHRCHSHHPTDWSCSCLSNSHCTAQGLHPRKAKQYPRPSTLHKLPLFRDCHHQGFPFRFFIRFRQWLWSFKILWPSPSRWMGKAFFRPLHHRTCIRLL